MKKILFVTPSYQLGGTNTSLLNLVSNVDSSHYELYIYAINNNGPLKGELQKYCHPLNPSGGNSTSSKPTIKSRVAAYGKKLFWLVRSLGLDLSFYYYKKVAKSFDNYGFDCIIAFQEGNATKLVSYCTGCKKVAWIRSEYTRYLKLINHKPETDIYSRYNLIVNVSQTALKNFLSVMPQFNDKSIFVYNLLNKDRVMRLSEESCSYSNSSVFTIVSLGRVDPVKRFSEIPQIADFIKGQGLAFKWLVIGGKQASCPEEYDGIVESVVSLNLQEEVMLLGNQKNPYSYLKQADLLVCLSESETFNHTFFEARLLNVPVLSVDYESASEMLQPRTGGLIVSRKKIGEEICRLINDKEYYKQLELQISAFSYDNHSILTKVYQEVF